jgi:hypothetical protein
VAVQKSRATGGGVGETQAWFVSSTPTRSSSGSFAHTVPSPPSQP